MTVRDLCRATIITSDNTAANLLFDVVGGRQRSPRSCSASGDAVSRSDRLEPELNSFAKGDPRDTTTPAAMAGSLQRVVLGKVLQPASRQQLADWLIDNETGDRLRAGLGKRWRVGDKTGSNGEDARNDIAVLCRGQAAHRGADRLSAGQCDQQRAARPGAGPGGPDRRSTDWVQPGSFKRRLPDRSARASCARSNPTEDPMSHELIYLLLIFALLVIPRAQRSACPHH